ncbi:hypothetical protein WJM97_17570 [Okeanomitos corallinicola TIOX110]|uniref:Sulfotransferase domain-containing protein n=1 Tax=Okeanomitos corallinicola TIOX110 TaxID=3133117 RepID=A0ABZ2UUD8_9CYAN
MNLKNSKITNILSRRKNEFNIYLDSLLNSYKADDKFVIFSQGRTGSTLLCDLLNSHPKLHCDREILYDHVFFPNSYINGKSKNSSKSIYGFKVKIYQLTQVQKIKDPKYFLENLHKNNWKIIYLKRDNLFRHALSNLVALNKNQYHLKVSQELKEKSKINVDCELLIEIMSKREKFLKEEADVLRNIPHITITYEDDLLRQKQHQNTLNNIFDFLDIDSHLIGTTLLKIVPDNLESIIENYEEVISKVSQSQYVDFLHTKQF